MPLDLQPGAQPDLPPRERSATTEPVVLHTRVVCGAGGGPEKTILTSPRFLEPLGYRAICAYMRPPADPLFEQIRQKAASLGAPLVEIDDRGAWDVGVVRRMLAVCRDNRVAIWHGHDYKSNAIGLVLRKLWPMHLVTTVHGWVKFTRRTPLYYGIDRFCLRHYERVICVSADLHELCIESGVPADRCILVHNAIDTSVYTRRLAIAEAKRRLGFDPQRPLVGAVGRLSEEKGFDILIRAVDQSIRAGLDLDLAIIGEGDAEPQLKQLIATLGLQDRIHLLGYRSDMLDVYQAFDVFALSSIREGLPNVVLEALALEVPIIATRVAGVPRIIEHEQNGLLVEPGSVDQLATALQTLLKDQVQQASFRAAGRATIEGGYTFEQRMLKIRDIYNSVLGASGGGPAA